MTTLVLAFIQSKYGKEFIGVYGFTIMYDMGILMCIGVWISG